MGYLAHKKQRSLATGGVGHGSGDARQVMSFDLGVEFCTSQGQILAMSFR